MTYNEIIAVIQNASSQHLQVASFGEGDPSQIEERDNAENLKYPMLWVYDRPHTVQDKSMYYNLTLVFGDLVKPDRSNETEVINDQLLIAQDFIAILNNPEFIGDSNEAYLDKEQSITITPFTEQYTNRISGVQMDVRIRQPYEWDRCITPVSGNTQCDGTDYCSRLLNRLSPSEKNECILPDYNFANTSVTDNLTLQQQSDLTDLLCGGGGGDVTITDSSGTVLYIVTAPDTQAITNSTLVIRDSDGNTLSTESILAQSSGNVTVSPVSGNIAYKRPQVTGQLTSYRTGDDGWHLTNNTYDYTPPAFPTNVAKLDPDNATPVQKLMENNAFGVNKNRFTDDAGGQTYSNNYAIDHLTGLGWYIVPQGTDNWNDQIDNAVASTLVGFSDWRLANRNELDSLLDHELSNVINYTPFDILGGEIIFSSTTSAQITTNAFFLFSSGGVQGSGAKTNSNRYGMYVRNHYT